MACPDMMMSFTCVWWGRWEDDNRSSIDRHTRRPTFTFFPKTHTMTEERWYEAPSSISWSTTIAGVSCCGIALCSGA